MRPNYKKIAVVILTSFAIGIVYNSFSANGIPLIKKEAAVVFDTNEELTESETENLNEIKALTTEQVYEIFGSKEAKFVDARDNWDFADGHIPGAINIPEYKFTPDDPNLKLLDKNEKIIVYCEGDQCEVSKRLAIELKKIGYKKVWIYLGGWEEWSGNKLPIEKE